MPLLVISKKLELFVNKMTVESRYCLHNREKLLHAIQMYISKKLKAFSQFFAAFLKSSSIFEHFEEKDEPHS